MFKDASLVQTQSSLPTSNAPRLNVVAVMAFFSPVVLGLLASFLIVESDWSHRRVHSGIAGGPGAKDREAVGKRRCIAPWSLHRSKRARPVLDHSFRGYDSSLDRPARNHHEFCS